MSELKSYSLEQLADIRISNVDKKSKPNENLIRLCNYMDVYSNDYITNDLAFMESTASSVECAKFKVDKGDILITKDSETPYDIGIPSVVTNCIEDLICGYHLALIKPNRNIVNPLFLSKLLAASDTSSYFSRVAAGSTRYGLSNGAIAKTKVVLPLLEKQNKIATVLLSIDRTIAKTEAIIEKYQQIKAGLMHDLFTRGIGADGKLRSRREEAPELYRESAIGWIPKEWDIRHLESLTYQIVDGSHFTPKYIEHGVPFLRVTDIQSSEIDINRVKFISNKEHDLLTKRCLPQKGDVLLSKNGTVGIARVVDWDWQFSMFVSLCLIRPALTLVADYLTLLFSTDLIWSQIRQRAKQGTVNNLHLEEIREFLIPLPVVKEQNRILEKIGIVIKRIVNEQNELKTLKMLKSGLMHDLLTGKVSVNVDSDTP